ncbi:MAG TPA: FAD-dependent oxidoreductase [Baekduia sp.]|uniref:NAD(P)/FAD-dependent oxidoreductase n=1 Tax=Baekduia sp. TaxID=2600305 RepID=UPI002D79ABAE|nr:FAD-dependent oxidoreductase [Baekduia sp.]HET6506162.1 FAD-dependent oxidoreductase [Baekduia sp.]
MRIAVIGAGISGLVVAHQAHRAGHDVHVLEAGGYAGGHTNTIRVDEPDATLDVDTGFIVFNDRNYPNFERLLGQLKVEWQPSEMSFGVGDEHGDFEYASTSPNALYAKRAHLASPAFHRMILDVRRFQREARALLASDENPSLAQWLDDRDFSPAFVRRLIVPQAAAVWSADPEQMWTFPARFLVQFFDHHGMLDLRGRPRWRVVRGGSRRYVEALTAPFADRIRLRAPVRSVVRGADDVRVDGERFDHVVLATHADQTLRILGDDATPLERELLSAFPYAPNEAVLHHDRRLLPRRRRAWASWNYHLLDAPPGRPTVTYHMNRLQSLRGARRQWCVTLNRSEAIDPDAIVRTIQYAHPVFTRRGMVAQGRVEEISGGRSRTHFAGAYWGWGFHEDGVVSGLRVARELGIDTP